MFFNILNLVFVVKDLLMYYANELFNSIQYIKTPRTII
jgi:hypothetical protein